MKRVIYINDSDIRDIVFESVNIIRESAHDNVTFNEDNAYRNISKQCSFGPRVPDTNAHTECGKWLYKTLQKYCDKVIKQTGTVKAYNDEEFDISNYIGKFNPSSKERILLLAHWDSRPFADMDSNKSNRNKPVMGANDAASGVGVLIEIARILSEKRPDIGVDILFTDMEDYGSYDIEDSWCLGTQYWSKNNGYSKGNKPKMAILLDMVGAKDATFNMESVSSDNAEKWVKKIWKIAKNNGYGKYFKSKEFGSVTDDHVWVNKSGIPCLDIIDTRKGSDSIFFEQWHTYDDTMKHIDKKTLKAVGQTLINYIYSL